MCARYSLFAPSSELQSAFELFDLPEFGPRYNIAPSTSIPAVVADPAGNRELRWFHWGFVPSWAQDPTDGPINARSETASEKPMFRTALRKRRCLIPASGFFEWRTEGGRKQPYFAGMADGSVLAFAGLWERWQGDDQPLDTCAILTTEPNELLANIHNRMPVIVERAFYPDWLDPEQHRTEPLIPLLQPFDPALMVAYAVDHRVGNPRFDSPEAVRRQP